MKVSVSITDLRDALNVASLTLSKRLGSADNALLYLEAKENGALYLFSFDGIARTMVKVSGTVETPGKTVINPTNLIGSLSKVIRDGNITLTQSEKKDSLQVTGAGRRMKFQASGEMLEFENQLSVMPLAKAETFVISASTFKQLIRQSAPFVERPDKEDGKDINRGDTNLLIKATDDGFQAYATEGRTAMAVVTVKDEHVSQSAVDLKIPIRSVLNLKNMLEKMKGQEIKVIIGTDVDGEPNAIYLRTDNILYGTQLDVAKFRDFSKVLSQEVGYKVELPREHFQALVSNASPFIGQLKDEDRVLVLYLGRNKVRITAGKGTETFEEEAESHAVQWPENNETAVRMAFSPEVLATVARVIQGQKVSIAVDARQILAFFTSEQDDFKAMYVLAKYADAKPAAVSVPKAA